MVIGYQILSERSSKIDQNYENWWTPHHSAAKNCHRDINQNYENGWTPHHSAAKNGHREIEQNHENGWTQLHSAQNKVVLELTYSFGAAGMKSLLYRYNPLQTFCWDGISCKNEIFWSWSKSFDIFLLISS